MPERKHVDLKISAPLDHIDRLKKTQEAIQTLAERHFHGGVKIIAELDLEGFDAHFFAAIKLKKTTGQWRGVIEEFKADVRNLAA